MKKVILTLVLGLFFVAFSNAQSNAPGALLCAFENATKNKPNTNVKITFFIINCF